MFRGDQKGQYDLDTKQTSRDARLQQLIADLVGKAGPLLDKLEKKYAAPTTEGIRYTSGIARALAESIGYDLFEAEAPADNQSSSYAAGAAAGSASAPAEEDPDLKALQAIMMQLNDISDPKVEPIKDRYAALLQMMDTTKKAAADKEKQAADTKNAQAEADALTREGLKKKIARLKELLDKQKAKKGGITPGQNARDDLLARQGSTTDPLARDDATKNALPKGMTIENLSESEIIARLRKQLEDIENRIDEGDDIDENVFQAIGQGVRGAVNLGRNFIGGIGGRAATGTVRSADELAAAQKATNAARKAAGKKPLTKAQQAQQAKAGIGAVNPASKAARVANTAGQAIRANPVKTALATAAGGAAIGYGLNKDDPKQDVTPVPTPGPVGPGPAPDPTPAPAPAPDPTPAPAPAPDPTPATPGDDPDMKEIGQLMSEIGQYTLSQDAPADVVDMATKELDAARKALKELGLDAPAEE
jgi:hypothetical protein